MSIIWAYVKQLVFQRYLFCCSFSVYNKQLSQDQLNKSCCSKVITFYTITWLLCTQMASADLFFFFHGESGSEASWRLRRRLTKIFQYSLLYAGISKLFGKEARVAVPRTKEKLNLSFFSSFCPNPLLFQHRNPSFLSKHANTSRASFPNNLEIPAEVATFNKPFEFLLYKTNRLHFSVCMSVHTEDVTACKEQRSIYLYIIYLFMYIKL